jgi:hypothetical protein
MLRANPARLVCGCLLVGGCLDLEVRPPPAPEGFPQPDRYEDAKAELSVDGEMYVSQWASGLTYNEEGGFEDELRVSLNLDRLYVHWRELETGVVEVQSGDLTASWDSYEADTRCGSGRMELMGLQSYDSGLHGDRDFAWGIVQLEVCESVYGDEVPDRMEITGRFTTLVDYQ